MSRLPKDQDTPLDHLLQSDSKPQLALCRESKLWLPRANPEHLQTETAYRKELLSGEVVKVIPSQLHL